MITEPFACTIPLSSLFKNILPNDANGSVSLPLVFEFTFKDVIYANNEFFYIDKTCEHELIYRTKNTNCSITFTHITISEDMPSVTATEQYKNVCRRAYKKQHRLTKRTEQINGEIERVKHLQHLIITEIVHNLNLNKKRKGSHVVDVKNKLNDDKKRKPVFLYDLHNLSDAGKDKMVKNIQDVLGVIIDARNVKLEHLYIYFALCNVMNSLQNYNNYLNFCITHINDDLFNLNKQYCLMNDVIEGRLVERNNTENYSQEFVVRDYNAYAIDYTHKCQSIAYVLALSKSDNRWNIYPEFNDNFEMQHSITDEQINEFILTIEKFETEGIDLFW